MFGNAFSIGIGILNILFNSENHTGDQCGACCSLQYPFPWKALSLKLHYFYDFLSTEFKHK